MKVLQVINSLGTGGAEKLILDTVPKYREKGLQVDVLLLWDNNFEFTKKIKELDCCTIYTLRESENYKDIYSIKHIFKMKKIFKNYDVVHVHLFPSQYFAVLANFLLGNLCKLLFTEHNTTNTRMNFFVFRFLDRLIYKGYKKIIAITDDVKKVMENYLKVNKIVTINNGVDLEGVKLSKEISKVSLNSNFVESDVILTQVGGFREQKDQDTTIRSLKYLPKNFHLVLVGDGIRKNELVKIVNENNLENRVHFVGIRNDVNSILKAVDYIIVSSHWEGFGLAAVEGMAAKKPVLASNVKGLQEVVKDAGILFEKGNEHSLAENILTLHSNPSLYSETANKCYERAHKYDISLMVDQHIELYKEIYEN